MINLTEQLQSFGDMEPVTSSPVDVMERRNRVALEVIRNMPITNIEHTIDENILKLMLLRVPMPRIVFVEYVNEKREAHYRCVSGQAVINTLAACLHDDGLCTPRNLERRLEETELDTSILRCGMTIETRDKVLKLMGLL